MVKQPPQNTIAPQQNTGLYFARHETFYPRFGWLKKGFEAVNRNPHIFLAEDAHIQLGVGKNMAKAIRYWCGAFKLIQPDSAPSDLGISVLGDSGCDRFLEDPATLWWLHWHLLKSLCTATTWDFTFNSFRQVDFTQIDLNNALKSKYADSRVSESSLKKDVACLLRMYVRQKSATSLNEDHLDCPFAELGVIHQAGGSEHFTFRIGSKPNLPAEIIVAACLDYAESVGSEQRTISISRLLFDYGSPGLVFKLSESALYDALEQVSRWCNALTLSDSTNLLQMSFTEAPNLLKERILEHYYQAILTTSR